MRTSSPIETGPHRLKLAQGMPPRLNRRSPGGKAGAPSRVARRHWRANEPWLYHTATHPLGPSPNEGAVGPSATASKRISNGSERPHNSAPQAMAAPRTAR
jgi:hypothetical protein